MSARREFVVATDPITSDQASAFRDWLTDKEIGWWHWIDNVWLLETCAPDIDASSIRAQVTQIVPDLTCLVSEVNTLSWSGYGPKSEKQDMFEWLQDCWGEK